MKFHMQYCKGVSSRTKALSKAVYIRPKPQLNSGGRNINNYTGCEHGGELLARTELWGRVAGSKISLQNAGQNHKVEAKVKKV